MAEVNLGRVFNNTIVRRRDFVGSSDPIDTFSFSTVPFGNGDNSNINISLTGMTGDADVRVFRDFNGNGVVDSNDRLLGSSNRSGNNDETINLSSQLSGVDAGSYVVEVKRFNTANTSYDLKVSASANGSNDPSLLLPAEINVGTLSGTRNFTGSLSNSNTVDTYRFNVTSTRSFFFRNDSNAIFDPKMRLIQDKDNDREIDKLQGEILAESRAGVGGVEVISQTLTPGTYYLQVHSDFSANNYTLTMS